MGSDLDSHADSGGANPLNDIQQIAHDLNNQVMVIQGNASLLRMKATECPEIGELTEQIIAACKQAAALTRQLTATSGETGGTE